MSKEHMKYEKINKRDLQMKLFKRTLLLSILILSIIFFIQSPSFAWTVSPVRFEIKAEKGKEYTLTFSVLNESQLHQKRFEVQTDDWTIDKNNNFLRKAFSKEVNNIYSATNWIKVTPREFVVPPGETKSIRFTITVPYDLPSDGEYATGIFVGEKNIEKPPKGEKIVFIKQDTYIGVIVYVRIGDEKLNLSLKDLKVETKAEKGLSRVTLFPLYENSGNAHTRAQITVKAEPLTTGTLTSEEFNAGEVVVLRESKVAFPIDVPKLLSPNTEWKFTINADLGKDKPLLIGTKKYKIPEIAKPKTETKK